jgi:hypothetical protein
MPEDFSWDLDGDGAFDDASGFILNYLEIPGPRRARTTSACA